MLVVEPGFKWDAYRANANASLFGDRRLVDLRIPSGKPGAEGGKALEAYAANPNPDNVTLITLPRLDKATQASAWFAASPTQASIAVQPLDRDALPRWVAGRLARQKQKASPETLAFLADRCEGNLLAARQEIEKLGLLLPKECSRTMRSRPRSPTSLATTFRASEAWLSGDAARALRVLSVLEAEGDGPQLALWALGEDLHALAAVQAMTRDGMPMATALRNARVWGKRQSALERAAGRVTPGLSSACSPGSRVDALRRASVAATRGTSLRCSRWKSRARRHARSRKLLGFGRYSRRCFLPFCRKSCGLCYETEHRLTGSFLGQK